MYMSDFSVVARSVTYSQDYYGGTSSGSLEAKKERWTRAFSLSLLMNIPKEAGRAAGCWRPPNCLKLLHAGQNQASAGKQLKTQAICSAATTLNSTG